MTISNTFIRNASLALAAVLFVALAVAVAPKAQAADLSSFDTIDTFSPDVFGGGFDTIDTFSPDVFGGGFDTIDTFSPDTFSSFGGSGFSSPSSFLSGLGSMGGGNRQSQSQSQSQAQSQSQTSTNTNTNVSTNTNTINVGAPIATANVTVTTPAQAAPVCPQGTTGTYPNCVWPTPNCPTNTYGTYPNCQQIQVCPAGSTGVWPNCYTQPQYDVCYNLPGIQTTVPAGYYVQNGNCYQSYVQPNYPVYNQPTPYVTLAAAPYTGLDLGTTGTALYWGFLALWCLLAAYLIAVKKVHNKLAAWLAGSTPVAASAVEAPVAHAPAHKAVATEYQGLDPFIASQIHRA